jgi:hypothetical protein
MIVTHRRVVFVRGGEVVLEMPRGWLRPEPVLRRDGVLELFVAMPGGNLFDEPLRVPLRMREGHPAAGHIIAMLAPSGVRHISPDALSGLERAREATPPPRFGSFWDEEPDPLLNTNGLVGAVDDFDQHPDRPPAKTDHSDWAPLEPPDRVVRVPTNPPKRPSTSGFPIAGMLPRDQRRSPWRLLVRVAALTVLLATAAALGAGRLNLQVPGSANEPVLVAPTATVPPTSAPTDVPETAFSPNQESAITIGVGGPAAQVSAADTCLGKPAPREPGERRLGRPRRQLPGAKGGLVLVEPVSALGDAQCGGDVQLWVGMTHEPAVQDERLGVVTLPDERVRLLDHGDRRGPVERPGCRHRARGPVGHCVESSAESPRNA